MLVEYLQANPKVRRPTYLIQKGAFHMEQEITSTQEDVQPFYEYFTLRN